MANIEILKETGAAIANICQSYAKELATYRDKQKQQLSPDWSDATMNISATEISRNNDGNKIVIDWAGRSQVYLPSTTFSALKGRYCGHPQRFLTNLFGTAKRYETRRIVVSETAMDHRLPPSTLSCLTREAGVSIDAWSDPLSVFGNCTFFWGFS